MRNRLLLAAALQASTPSGAQADATGPFSRPTITTLNTGPDAAGKYSSIAIGPDGHPQIAFYEYTIDPVAGFPDFTNGDAKFARCHDAACSGNLTTGFIQSDSEITRDAGAFIQVVIDSTGAPMYAFYDRGGPRPQDAVENVAFSRCARELCTQASSNLDGPFAVGEYTSLALTPADIPVLAYYDATHGELKVVRCMSDDCTGSQETRRRVADDGGVAVGGADVGQWTSIAQDSADRSLVSYYDATNGNLKIVRCAAAAFEPNGACEAPVTVDAVGDVGRYTDVVMGPGDKPAISYYDVTNQALKVAACNDALCSTATITTIDDDATNNVGLYSSIVIPTDGLPVISYIDDTAHALKLAKCHKPDCSIVTEAGDPRVGTAATLTPIDMGQVLTGTTAITFGADTFPIMTYPVVVNGVERIRVAKSNTPDGTEDKFFEDGFESP